MHGGAWRGPWSSRVRHNLVSEQQQQEENRICFSLVNKVVAWQKPTQPCKTIILQLKKNILK